MDQPQTTLKIILVGDSSVGKTCFVLQWAEKGFREHFLSTIGVDFKTRTVPVGSKRYRVQVWDTAGQERYRTLRKGFYRGAKGVILMYDVTQDNSFANIRSWMTDVTEVPTSFGESEAQVYGARFAEVSAKTGEGIETALNGLVEDIVSDLTMMQSTSCFVATTSSQSMPLQLDPAISVGNSTSSSRQKCSCK